MRRYLNNRKGTQHANLNRYKTIICRIYINKNIGVVIDSNFNWTERSSYSELNVIYIIF